MRDFLIIEPTSDKGTLDYLRIDRTTRRHPLASRLVVTALILTVVTILAGFWWLKRPQSIVVETVVVREEATGAPQTLLNASGYVTARRSATVSSKVTGKVTEVLVEEGRKVEEGEVLARLDSANVVATLRLAEAQLNRARKSLEELEPNLVFARQELKRFTNLAATKAVSDSDLRRSETETRVLEAKLARQFAEITVAESEIAQWQQQRDDMTIRAPFAGVVTSKNAQPGEMISPMSVGGFTRTGICTIVDMGSLEIEVDVSESYINRVVPGGPVEATLDAYPDWRIPARVIAIIPTADRQKATVKVRIGFEALDPRILPEMAVKVAFRSGDESEQRKAARTRLIPKSALQQSNGRDVVWVVRDGRVERRAVTVVTARGDDVAIAAGLDIGERIVVNAAPTLADGSRVTARN